ncbi:rho guanine nucleotide exchange factor 39 [Biomphalaria glabrata]|nr:rho guanine nucleotide exchange factor 39-like [Biomphalaria glabrata]
MSLSGEAVLYATSPCDKVAQETARKERRRRKIIRELFQTEKTYLHHLELINKFFDFPLRFACLVPDKVHATLFSNIEQIRQVNVTLLETMEESTVGQAFKQLAPFLKLYSTYANNHQSALNALQEWQNKSPDFAAFISRQEDRPEVMGLKVNALLITPVQRIPRYKLLLEDLLSSTSDDHHDYKDLSDAANKIAEIAAHINECLRQNENFLKTLTIQKSFDSSAPKLLMPGRFFIKEGPLKKVSRKGGKSYERMFFLFSDILLYGKPKFLDGGGKSYTCSCVLPLRHCKVEPVFITSFSKSDAGGVFKITCKEESLVLYSDDKKNAREWSEEISKAVRKICDDRQTLRKPSSNKIPLRGRSLRRHRQQQKKLDIKIPGKTPLRPLSVISSISDDFSSDSIARERSEDFGEHMSSVFDLSTCSSYMDSDATALAESPIIRKKKCYQTSTGTLSLRDSCTDSDVYRQSMISSESQNSGTSQHANTDSCTGEENLRKDKETRNWSKTENKCMKENDSSSLCRHVWDTHENVTSRTNSEGVKTLSSQTNSSTSSTAWFPPNSPAHKHLQKKTLNMKLRSCFKRFRKSKNDST